METPFVRDSETSHAAAESMLPFVNRLEAMVVRRIGIAGDAGMTCDEAEDNLQMKHQTCSARIKSLVDKGLLVDSGVKRVTRSGRKAVVWVVSQAFKDRRYEDTI